MFAHALLYALLLLGKVAALLIGGAVDSSYDAWATALSDVGPLILLIGERSTKQLLRDVRSISGAFSLAAAPLGLVSIVTSLLRMSGSHRVRSFLGYEQESRSVAALELSRINCNGVHPELIDGYLVRTTAAISARHAGVVGVSALQSDLTRETAEEAIAQATCCNSYEAAKARLRVPKTDAKLKWCSQMAIADTRRDGLEDNLFGILSAALQIDLVDQKAGVLRKQLRHVLHLPDSQTQSQPSKVPRVTSKTEPGDTLCFVIIFDAISEYCTANSTSRMISMLIGLSSSLVIMGLYVIELRFSRGWTMTTGWLLTIIGYLGIVTFVTLAARHIQLACCSIRLRSKDAKLSERWQNGLAIAAQSDNKGGADFLVALNGSAQVFEAIWLRPLNTAACIKADVIGILLTLSFLCHYLGLRSSSWWLGVCELAICISAAFARSLTKSRPVKFQLPSNGLHHSKVDWRCCSTGLITVQQAHEVDDTTQPHPNRLDLRIYSSYDSITSPVTAESVAWLCAVLCLNDQTLMSWLLDITGMRLSVCKTLKGAHDHAIIASFSAGILCQEGLASTDVNTCVGFSCNSESLSAPTPWFARAIMRQPQWRVNRDAFVSITDTIGKVHVPSLSSLMTWWTMSELRNGPEDNQENLQWAFLLLNTVFFALLQSVSSSADTTLLPAVALIHGTPNPKMDSVARSFFERMKAEQLKSGAHGSVSQPGSQI
ncbi:hypothetical protein ABEF95_002552 [Exophiala dermatitidis]